MPKQRNNSIPLLCNLCPKNPKFSDVSHLLTHISSKSHLSNRFKLQIRSQSEPEARKILSDFDNWYAANGLEELLSERLAAKEQKRNGKGSRLSSIAANAPRKPKPRTANVLQEPIISHETYRPPIPRMHTWSTETYAAAMALPLPLPAPLPPQPSPWKQDVYATPTTKRSIPNFCLNQSPPLSSPEHSVETLHPTPKPDDTEDEGIDNDASKLKGVFWPGMHLFDSATAEMKRMRNQKKDGTALERMKIRSTEIEPTEWIFNPNGDFRRSRDIFDESTEDLPEQSIAVPTPKKRRSRKALADMNVNLPRRPRSPRNPAKKPIHRRKKTASEPKERAAKKSSKQTSSNISTNQFSPSIEEHEEFRLALEDFNYRQLNIFRDVEAASPGRTESPLGDHGFNCSNGRPLNKSILGPQNSPTPICKPVSTRFSGKESLDPGHLNIRTMSAVPGGWNPGFYHNDYSNPLHAHPHAHAYGYSERDNIEADFKVGISDFAGDFRPMTNAFAAARTHSFLSRPDVSLGEMHFGR